MKRQRVTRDPIAQRRGRPADAEAIHALVADNLAEGHLLPRHREELALHASRFTVTIHRGRVIGCAELVPLSPTRAELRSLAVDATFRGRGIGSDLVADVQRQALAAGFDELCLMTHTPTYFTDLGFAIVPHRAIPEKVATDCVQCAKFGSCGQLAMVFPLEAAVAGSPRSVDPSTHRTSRPVLIPVCAA